MKATGLALMMAMAGVGMGWAQPEAGAKQTRAKATVRAMEGEVSLLKPGGDWQALKVGVTLEPGTEIRTGAGAHAYLSVNGVSSVVRVDERSDLALDKMLAYPNGDSFDRETMLELKSGTILGNVKKISGNSRYEVVTTYGVMGVRGTDYEVTVETNAARVTFSCITGQCVCVPEGKGQRGQAETKILNAAETVTYEKGTER
jgi:hypothetical protein